MTRPIDRRSASLRIALRCAGTLLAAISAGGCGESPLLVVRDGETPRPYMQFSVVVERSSGSLGPAQTDADAVCAQVLQSALMYMSTDVGDDRTRYYFRCR